MERNAEIKAERALNTDKILAEERAALYRRQRRDEQIEAKKAAAHQTKSLLKRALLIAKIHSLELAKRHDNKDIEGLASNTSHHSASLPAIQEEV
mmetsp:Transcript_1433/g.1887  ORF Transcript_1433/g.1887 Transcript_1433/m.1887 type:complete len:95 (-) Transcript_1433:37-321(-)